jgi:hypothetical protein
MFNHAAAIIDNIGLNSIKIAVVKIHRGFINHTSWKVLLPIRLKTSDRK